MSSEVTDSTAIYEIWAWFEVNKKRLITAAVVVAVLAFFISLAIYLKKQKEIEASAALIRLATQSQVDAKETAPADILKIVSNYPSTAAAERASLEAATAYFGEQKYSEALDQFKRFQSTYPDSRLMPQAALGVAASLEASNKIDEAMKAYQDVVTRYGSDSVAAQAKFSLGRLNEDKKQYEQALKYYQELTSSATSRSFWNSEAADRTQLLLAQFPNLAPKPVVPVMPTTNAVAPNVTPAPALEPAGKTNAAKPAAGK